MLLYDVGLNLAKLSFRLVWASKSLQRYFLTHRPKAYKFIMGQKDVTESVKRQMGNHQDEVIWFHAASYGEYNVIRPVIKKLKQPNRRIVVTFFSSTGYEILTDVNTRTNEVDHVFYLPLDTPSNVRHFLDSLRPDKAVFTISEYWINYLTELRKRQIPTYQVSMIVGDDSYLLKWYARPIRKALRAIKTFMVLDGTSKQNLAQIGFDNVIVTGDPLFDNAIAIAHEDYHNEIIENFCADKKGVFVAGSISDDKDLALVSALANANQDVKFIIVPHEISDEEIQRITSRLEGKTLRYSACDPKTTFDDTQVLIIDFVGALAHIYRYGNWAYVGGGFTPYLHSIIEPVVYGIPVAFGPRIERKNTPLQMVKRSIGRVVNSEEEIKVWLDSLREQKTLDDIRQKATLYTESNANATQKVLQMVLA